MFRLVTIEEVVQVPPRLFALERFEAMEIEVNRKYCNKVLSGVGVCVSLWDWVSAKDHRLVPHTGDANTSCVFRMLVFAPQVGEVLRGTVAECTKDGLEVDVDFVGGIRIAKVDMPARSVFKAEDQNWLIIHSATEEDASVDVETAVVIAGDMTDGAPKENCENGDTAVTKEEDDIATKADVVNVANTLDVGNVINFEVLGVFFADGVDKPPEDPKKEAERAEYIMTIRGGILKPGLGRYDWWAEDANVDAEADDVSEEGDGYAEEGEGYEEEGEEYGEEEEFDETENMNDRSDGVKREFVSA
jgi:DNA-directed RNA polymerase subunit E'/Rpb7